MTDLSPDARRIVVGIDGSESSMQALRWALRQATATGATVQAVGSWEWPATAAAGGVMPYLDLAGTTQQAVQDAVSKATAGVGFPSETVQTRVVEGHPSRVLVEAAHGAELLVVGSRGHGTFSGVLLGSVGLHCASHAPCPVVIVRDAA